MTKIILVYLSCLLLFSCKASGPDFARMTSAELAAYNKTVPLTDKIVCREGASLASRIPKRRCETEAERYDRAVSELMTFSNVGQSWDY